MVSALRNWWSRHNEEFHEWQMERRIARRLAQADIEVYRLIDTLELCSGNARAQLVDVLRDCELERDEQS